MTYGNIYGAREIYQEVLRKYPDAVAAQGGLIKASLGRGKYTPAQVETNKLLSDFATHPDFAKTARSVADAFRCRERYSDALQVFQAALNKQLNLLQNLHF